MGLQSDRSCRSPPNSPPGCCLVGKMRPPRGGGGLGYRDGWVGWPQIPAFWATRQGGGGAFFGSWVCEGF